MKIVLAGGSGQVGRMLANAFLNEKHEVVVLSRDPIQKIWKTVFWDAETLGDWQSELEGADVVVGLAGKNVNCRYTENNRRLIMDSRVKSTRILGQAISRCLKPPRVWLQASTATIYAHTYGEANDEDGEIGGNEPDAPAKWRFSIEVAEAWERAAMMADTPNTRRVLLRSALIMDPAPGGIFDLLMTIVRLGASGRADSGKQYISWIHDQDFVRVLNWLIEREDFEGIVNISSPNPLPYNKFMAALRKAQGNFIALGATPWMLEIAAFFLRTETELILKSRNVIPGRLLEAGFEFDYPQWGPAAEDLVARWRTARKH